MKILINALSGNGDALMFSPALRVLRERLPDAVIDLLVMFRSVGEMYANHPAVSEVHFIDFLKQSKMRSFSELRNLSKKEYDFSLNVYPSNRVEYNIVNAFAGAKFKLSHHYLNTNVLRCEFFNDILIDEVKDRHNVLQNLDLIKEVIGNKELHAGPMEIFTDKCHDERAEQWFKDTGLIGRKLAGIHAGSALLKNHINKRWSKDGYISLIKYMSENYGMDTLLFGTEKELNAEIAEAAEGRAFPASTPDFMDSISRMKKCSVFISNDTAFMHCAAALQIPVVAIFGYTNHKELYPWKVVHELVRKELDCSPCFYNSPKPANCIYKGEDEFKCIKSIGISEVIEAVDSVIKRAGISQ